MLVVTRKNKESIMIGENIEIVVIESKDGSVKLGIEAPRDIKVYRKEIFDEIKRANSEAAESDLDEVKRLFKIEN